MRTPCSLLVLAAAAATQVPAPTFAPPVRLQALDQGLGENRLYPSPVLHDMNGDGQADLVVGDLRGHLTVALRLPGAGGPRFGAETKLLGRSGKALDFGNW